MLDRLRRVLMHPFWCLILGHWTKQTTFGEWDSDQSNFVCRRCKKTWKGFKELNKERWH